jgi:hypothetical protein
MGTAVATQPNTCDNSNAVIEATPTHGHYFVRWEEDGNEENPRYLTVTQDTVFTAVFAADSIPVYWVKVNVSGQSSDMGTVTGTSMYIQGEEAMLRANARAGFRFVRWEEDGSEENPHKIAVTQNMIFTAVFVEESTPTFRVTVKVSGQSSDMGAVIGTSTYIQYEEAELTANAHAGHRFVHWEEDGNKDNPRYVTVTQDTTLTAVFEEGETVLPTYPITVDVNDPDMGTVTGGGVYALNEAVEIKAVPNEGYHFVQWSDNAKLNPRTVIVQGRKNYTAEFAIGLVFQLTLKVNDFNMGTVTGEGKYVQNSEVELRAIPNSGYRFVKWSDNVTANPRKISVYRDMTYTATFEAGEVDITEIASVDVILYPNPVRDVLHIRSSFAVERIIIHDLSGKPVRHITAPGPETDVSNLSRGLYFVVIKTAGGTTVRKLVKSN